MNTCVIVFGSNISPQENILLAKKNILEHFKILGQSESLLTKPLEEINQADFINEGLLFQTEMTQDDVRVQLRTIESRMGRPFSSPKSYAPRLIDIDMIVWNNVVIDRDFYQRKFLRQVVFELLPLVTY